MSKDKKPFIACNYSPAMSGHFATLYDWNGEFYEPYATGLGRYETLDAAEAEGRTWAAQEDIEFIPVDRVKAAAYMLRSQSRAMLIKALRDAGMSLHDAHRKAREEYPL